MKILASPTRNRSAAMKTAAVGAALTAVLFGASSCSVLSGLTGGDKPTRDAATGEVTESTDNADVFAIRVGDCVNDESSTEQEEITTLPVVPCGEPHDSEAFHAFNLADGDFPGTQEVIDLAFEGCYLEFENFVGYVYEESDIDFWPLYPTSGSWEQGDREVVCFVYDLSGQVTGTLAGAGR